MKYVIYISILLVLIGSTLSGNKLNTVVKAEKQNVPPLTNQMITQKTDIFMDKLVQPINEDYEVKTFTKKAELIKDFKTVASEQVAKKFVDFYYEERNNKLYIIPTELPPWFVNKQPYHIEKLNDKKMLITQRNVNELDGQYKINIEFSYVNGTWIISEVQYN